MAVPVRWLKEATAELDEIWEYISQDSPQNASRVVVRLVQAARDLGDYPRSGHVVPEFRRDEIREYPAWPFRLVYAVLPEEVVVLSIVHGAQEMPRDVVDRK
ncbi:MAG: type II toxin-antitoxin system RelE/ParE family toxin [Phycisphaeraceae bacterium]